ncbi:MAG: hypothetical protein BA863_07455 [Desulfovibrio sp. S3730MH75]|nr:MAG: hypothetical protein BA863_07455 [Desulfovibrio sp. S3730MH75]
MGDKKLKAMQKVKSMVGVFFYTSATRRHQGKPDKTFYISYKIEGKRKWEKIGSLSEKITAAYASQIRAERLRQMRQDALPSALSGKDMTFDEAWQRFKSTHLALSKHADTAINQDRQYRKHIFEKFGHLPLSKITTLAIEDLKGDLLKTYAPQTVTHVLAIFRQVYNKCIDWGIWNGDIPTRTVKMPKSDNSRGRYLTIEESDKLFYELLPRFRNNTRSGSTQTHQMALFSLHTGMRFNEIAKLRGEHVNLLAGHLRISESKNYEGRTIYLTKQLRAMLAEMPLANGVLLFPGRHGKPMSRCSQSFFRALDRLGFNDGITSARDKVVFHTLRHTFASWLVIEGVPLYVVSKLLGHKSLEMTQRYAHLCPDVQMQAISKLEEIISKQQSSSRSVPTRA